MKPPEPGAVLRVLEVLEGRAVLLTGATGFVGKVTLAMLLHRQPKLRRVLVLVRPRPGENPAQRLTSIVTGSPVFAPLRRRHGPRYEEFLQERVRAVPGDMTVAGLGIEGTLSGDDRPDLLVNVAGLVSFNPPLNESLDINAQGAGHAAALAAGWKIPLVHVSTCYVAGLRTGAVTEAGAALARPSDGAPLDAVRELSDCADEAEEIRREAADRLPRFEALARERASGARADRAVRLVSQRLQRQWREAQLAEAGTRRAREGGWPNTYCYAKALGEALIARTPGLCYAIVRPSIVESALDFPFRGWNEGLNTSAPVILAMCRGLTPWPAHPTAPLDVIPVDQVAAGILAVAGAALLGEHEPVYHLASSDLNPFPVRRCMHWVGEFSRRRWRDYGTRPAWLGWLLSRPGVVTVSESAYRRFGAPALRRALRRLADGAGRARLARLAAAARRWDKDLAQVEYVAEAFLPFIHDLDCVFRTVRLRALRERLSTQDRAALPFAPEAIDWRSYWFDVHLEGQRRWVFPAPGGRASGPPPLHHRLVRRAFESFVRWVFTAVYRAHVVGREHVPPRGGVLIASNHASHLDMGLIRFALGAAGEDLVSLAAKDYFFRHRVLGPLVAMVFNAVPISRHGAVRDALRTAAGLLRQGRNLLIFPEATRSTDGRMAPFKPTVGYLALQSGADVLPVYLSGTFQALPKGRVIPRPALLTARIGTPITGSELRRRTKHLRPKESYRAATVLIEESVRRLRDGSAESPPTPEPEASLHAP